MKVDLNAIEITDRKSLRYGKNEFLYRSWGSGKKYLVCLPGWPVSSLVFAPLAEAIGPEYTVIAFDYPGWAGSSRGEQEMKTLGEYASTVEEFVEGMDLDKFDLLGYSYGGIVAQKIVERGNVNAKRIVLVSTFRGWKRFSKDMLLRPGMEVYLRAVSLGMNRKRLEESLRKIYTWYLGRTPYYGAVADSNFMKSMFDEALAGDPNTLVGAAASLIEQDTLSDAIKGCDFLVVYGEDDLPFVRKDSEEMCKFLNSKQYIVPNGDHFHLVFSVEDSIEHIRGFLLE